MYSLDAMFEASPVYFQCVNERAAHVKNRRCFPSVSNFSCCWMAFDYRGFMNENQKALVL